MNNQLTTTSITPTSLAIIRADSKRFPRIKAIPSAEVNAGVRDIIQKAFLYKGQNADPAQIEFLAGTLVQELLSEREWGLPELSLTEIDYVVKKHILKDSEFFITIPHIYRALIAYCQNEGHTASLEARKMNTAKIPEELETLARIHAGRMMKRVK